MQQDISIRILTSNDLAVADRIVTSAFGLPESRASEIHRYLRLKPNCWFLASYREQPAGVVGATNYGPFAYLGMMTVRKELQRKGIGRTLLEHMLSWTEENGISCLRLDASPAGYPLYLQFGFEVLDGSLLFQLPDYSPFSNYPQQVRPLSLENVRALADFDTPIFGADRSGLFQVLLTDFPNRAYAVYDESGSMAGYLFAQSRRLGPWAARSLEDAEALLQAALTLNFNGSPLVIAPKMNRAALNLLERFGFRLELTNHHMQRGGSVIPGQRTAVYGITSFAIG
ncbi:MAG: GNAT family N-acetyltransferase [Desulfobacterales bacterium]